MKNAALVMAAAATLFATAASAREQRPTYLAFSAPAAASVSTSAFAPAAPKVEKRRAIAGVSPFLLLLAGFGVIGGLVAVVSDDNASPQ